MENIKRALYECSTILWVLALRGHPSQWQTDFFFSKQGKSEQKTVLIWIWWVKGPICEKSRFWLSFPTQKNWHCGICRWGQLASQSIIGRTTDINVSTHNKTEFNVQCLIKGTRNISANSHSNNEIQFESKFKNCCAFSITQQTSCQSFLGCQIHFQKFL